MQRDLTNGEDVAETVEDVGSFRLRRIQYVAFLLAVAYSVVPVLLFWALFIAAGGGVSRAPFALASTLSEPIRPAVAVAFFVIFYYLGRKPELWEGASASGVMIYCGVLLGSLADFVGIVTTTNSDGTVLSSGLAFNPNGASVVVLLVEAAYGFGLLFGASSIASARILWPRGPIDSKASARTAVLASFLVFASFLVTAAALWLLYHVQLPPGLFPIELADYPGDLVLPVLFFVILYLSGNRAYLMNGYSGVLAYLLVGCLSASVLGTLTRGYAESLMFGGGTLASFLSLGLLDFAVQQGVVASLLGFSAIYLGESRHRSSGSRRSAPEGLQSR